MSYGYPFPSRRIENVENKFAPLPHDVDYIHNYMQCTNAMSDAQYAAISRAQLRNDPRYLQYVGWFNAFENADRSVRRNDQDGNEHIDYWGGCKLLLSPETARTMWPAAREQLRTTLARYHNAMPMETNESPMTQCHVGTGLNQNNVQCQGPMSKPNLGYGQKMANQQNTKQ